MQTSRLTKAGYIKRSPEEIKTELAAAVKAKYSDFEEQPADIQNMLLDTSIQGLLEYENLMAEMINSYTPSFANDFMFLQMASSLGLKPKSEFKAQATLKFTGKKGDYIPVGTKVNGFETESSGVIGTTGELFLNAYSSDTTIHEANTLTSISTAVPTGVSVTNPSASLAYVPEETFKQFKERCQTMWRSPRVSSTEYARAQLLTLTSINPRLLNFFKKDGGIEMVVGGGEPSEVVNILFNSFFETQKFISQPSDNDTKRTISHPITYYGTTLTIPYTTPKALSLSLRMNIKFRSDTLSTINTSIITQEPITTLINEKLVGEPVSQVELQNTALNALAAYGYDLNNIDYVKFTASVNGTEEAWSTTNDLASVKFDCYVTLENFRVEVD